MNQAAAHVVLSGLTKFLVRVPTLTCRFTATSKLAFRACVGIAIVKPH
jgi:hypothetical protein